MSTMPTPPIPGGSVCYIKAQFVLQADDFSGIFTLVKEDFFFPPCKYHGTSVASVLAHLCTVFTCTDSCSQSCKNCL